MTKGSTHCCQPSTWSQLSVEPSKFVAHSNCQQKLVEIWYSGVRKVSKMNPIVIFFFIVMHILLLPISSIFYIIAPKSKVKAEMCHQNDDLETCFLK